MTRSSNANFTGDPEAPISSDAYREPYDFYLKPVRATMTMDANDVPIRRAVTSPPVASVRGLGLLNLGRVGWVGRGNFLFSYCRIEKDSVACRDAKIDSVRVNRRR